MKNKELKTFLDSDWGAVAGLSPQEAKDWNNIKSGRVSGRRILKMRKKLGLTGPKDYIDPNKPRVLESYYEKALDNWTGPSDDMQKGETDWDWCKRQVRFNKRFMGDVFGERKGPLVKNKRHRTNLLVVCFLFGFGDTTPGAMHERSRSASECLSVQMYLG